MRIALAGFEADVSTELVKSAKLIDEPLIVELINGYQEVCKSCVSCAGCTKYPFCSSIEVKERSVPLYPTGETFVDDEGETKPVMRQGEPYKQSMKTKGVEDCNGVFRQVKKGEYKGYEVVADPSDPTKILLEERVMFEEGTKILDITEEDLFPAGVETNFLIEKLYEIYPHHDKSIEKDNRNKQKLYEIHQLLSEKKKVAIKNGFVWRGGTYQAWAAIIEAMTFEDGKWLLTLKTTQAQLSWIHPQEVPVVLTELQVKKAPTVNNLTAITSFLSKVKAEQKPQLQVK